MAETAGELLGGRYRLLGERTSFPFGAWWEAEDDQGARTVVLRMNAQVADPEAKAKGAIEATAKLDSPHIVAWADGGVDGQGQGWLAAPMFGPWSLQEHFTKSEGIPPSEAAPLIHQLARAVAAAEAAGQTHNTLTSEFVRMVPLPEGGHGVKVYGFGLGDLLPSYKPLRKQDAYLGVPDYMSPELCAGKTASGSSADIYALGIMMYEAVRGRPPFAPTFASASTSTTLKRHIFEKPLPLHVRYASAAFIKSYETIAFKALAKTANRRHAAVTEIEQELEKLIVGEMRQKVVPVEALSSRGQTTSRRLKTQVIAQIPTTEAEPEVVIEAKEAPPPAKVEEPVAEEVEPAAAARHDTEPDLEVEAVREEANAAAAKPRTDATLVFAGLGPAVREMAEAARKTDEPEADAGSGAQPPASAPRAVERPSAPKPVAPVSRPRRKKGARKGTGARVVSRTAPTVPGGDRPSEKVQEAAAAVTTTPSSATVVTSRVSEAAASTSQPKPAGGTRPRPVGSRQPDAASVKAKEPLPIKNKDDQEWFDEEEARARKGSRAWILVLLIAAAVVVVVILLMSSNTKPTDAPPEGSEATPTSTEGTASRYPIGEEPAGASAGTEGSEPGAGEEDKEPTAAGGDEGPGATDEAATEPTTDEAAKDEPAEPDEDEAGEPVKDEAAAPDEDEPVEPVKAEKPEPAEPETPQPARVDRAEPAKADSPKPPEPAKAEAPEPEPEPEPAKAEAPKPEPAKAETPKPAADNAANQFRQKAKHYIELGIQAYKSENFKLAVGYFKKAQEADPSNAMAARYLKQASEKAQQ